MLLHGVIDRAHARSISIRKMLSTVRVRTVRYRAEMLLNVHVHGT